MKKILLTIAALSLSTILLTSCNASDESTQTNTEPNIKIEQLAQTTTPEVTTTPETTTTPVPTTTLETTTTPEITTTPEPTTNPEPTTTVVTTTPEVTITLQTTITTTQAATTTAVTTQVTTAQTTTQQTTAIATVNKPADAQGVDDEGYWYKFVGDIKYRWKDGPIGWQWIDITPVAKVEKASDDILSEEELKAYFDNPDVDMTYEEYQEFLTGIREKYSD